MVKPLLCFSCAFIKVKMWKINEVSLEKHASRILKLFFLYGPTHFYSYTTQSKILRLIVLKET